MINNNKAGGKKIAPVLKKVLILSATYLLLGLILVLGISPEQHDIQIGAPAPLDILATKDVIDTVTTDELRSAAAAAVEPSYKNVDPTVVGSVSSDMDALFNQLLALRSEGAPGADSITEAQLQAINEALPIALSADQYAALLSADEESL